MPSLTRWYLKSALLYLAVALFLSLLLALPNSINLPTFIRLMNPAFFHLFLVGWVTQIIFGVIYWMFPKYSKERPRGHDSLNWIAYWTLNIGLILRAIAEPLQASQVGNLFGALLVASAILQWLAGIAFIANTWQRVKER